MADSSARPNIVLMMADDMGMGDTSAYQDYTGNSDDVQIATPQMERLARMGVRMTDAHTPASRCSPTRYGLLTGRYPWRNRLKHWVLFGAQGDPMIEADRPTIASMLQQQGYATAMVGKWHVGLRYRRSDGTPADGWDDADLRQPLHTSPIDHGFDVAKFTSRSHGSSGPDAAAKNAKKVNQAGQSVGPGHIDGRTVIAATDQGKRLVADGPNAYVLHDLGRRHSDHAIAFLSTHIQDDNRKHQPFFLYYPSNSNHSPYTAGQSIDGRSVAGAARTQSGRAMDARYDFVYENDVALGRLIDWLAATEDPRNAGKQLLDTTLVIFTSDNGAEIKSDVATGPFRSNKGSVYEGGHRVPFIAAWPAGGIGDGDDRSAGRSYDAPIGLQDLYATFAEIVAAPLPDLRSGQKGAEDSFSILPALRGESQDDRPPLFFNDHQEAKTDPAVVAMRADSPKVEGTVFPGKWKLFFDARLLRSGAANPYELYDLATDPWETNDLIDDPALTKLVAHLSALALRHRLIGGHRLDGLASDRRVVLDFRLGSDLSNQVNGQTQADVSIEIGDTPMIMHVAASRGSEPSPIQMHSDSIGLGAGDSSANQADRRVDQNECIQIRFDRDVIVESAAILAGDRGVCGGFYQIDEGAPLAIYCVDADIDAKDQSGMLSDIGVLIAGQTLRLDSSPHFGVEAAGKWSLQTLAVRLID